MANATPSNSARQASANSPSVADLRQADDQAITEAKRRLERENRWATTFDLTGEAITATPSKEMEKVREDVLRTMFDMVGLCSSCSLKGDIDKEYEIRRLNEIVQEDNSRSEAQPSDAGSAAQLDSSDTKRAFFDALGVPPSDSVADFQDKLESLDDDAKRAYIQAQQQVDQIEAKRRALAAAEARERQELEDERSEMMRATFAAEAAAIRARYEADLAAARQREQQREAEMGQLQRQQEALEAQQGQSGAAGLGTLARGLIGVLGGMHGGGGYLAVPTSRPYAPAPRSSGSGGDDYCFHHACNPLR
jgi:hypothetical protein